MYFHDPSFGTTSGAASAICELDGEAGYLRYRGHPIEQLAEQANFLEVAHLLLFGELPTRPQLDAFADEIAESASIHENFHKRILEGFRDDAHAMGVLASSVAALSTFYPEGKDVGGSSRPPHPDDPPHRQDADARSKRLPSPRRHPVCPARPGPRLHHELPDHDVPAGRRRLRGRPGS